MKMWLLCCIPQTHTHRVLVINYLTSFNKYKKMIRIAVIPLQVILLFVVLKFELLSVINNMVTQ